MKKFAILLMILLGVIFVSNTTLYVENTIMKKNGQQQKSQEVKESEYLPLTQKETIRVQRGWVKVSTHHCIINDSCDSKIHYPNNNNIKELKAKVTDIDSKFVTFSTSDGMGWIIENQGFYNKGDKVVITFDDKGTEEMSDDEIIDESKQY